MAQYQELVSDDQVPQKPYSVHTLLRKKGILDRWEYQGDDMPLLRRVLNQIDIHSCGLCMTIGAGIFVVAGQVAREEVGPAVVISFLLAGLAALIASFSYSEFAARVPACGSTYSFVYVALGEFIGWIAGWITIMEYCGAAAVAHGIAQMIFGVGKANNIDLSGDLSMDNWNRIIATCLITCLTMLVLFVGIKGAARFCRCMSVLNISTIIFICVVGSVCIKSTENWYHFAPFAPPFLSIVRGAAKVFFAYTGFENSSTLATEAKDPKRHMPAGVIITLVISITLYVLSSLVITGMIPYEKIDNEMPFVGAFRSIGGLWWAETIVGIGALFCMITTMFTTLVGLPRILYQMSRDGLLWDRFSYLNRFKVPYIGTLVFGLIACGVSFMGLEEISDMISFGVLINYSLINMSVIALRFLDTERKMETRQVLALVATICSCVLVGLALKCPHYHIVTPVCLIPFLICMVMLYRMLPVGSLANPPVDSFIAPFVPFLPCIGTLLNIVMALQLGLQPLWQVFVWIAAGSVVYFAYGMRHSRLNFVKSTDVFYY